MSCTYASGLTPYENKGVLGLPEHFDNADLLEKKCKELVDMIEHARHVVVHTGAGISTSAGIPDFRGPKGVWTLEQKGEKPNINISFNDAMPTMTHMALRALVQKGYVRYIVSQNIDGLHMKSGLERRNIAELHGNMFVEQCKQCRRQFMRTTAAETVGQKPCSTQMCHVGCRGGILLDNILDWEADLPERDLNMAIMHASMADLNITLGTTLQIIPSGNLPLKNKRNGGKLVICNLQPTKHDKKADLIISAYVDEILIKVCKRLGIEIPEYKPEEDPTQLQQQQQAHTHIEWTLPTTEVKELEKAYNAKMKEYAKERKQQQKGGKTGSSKSQRTSIPKKKRKTRTTTKKEPKCESENSSDE